MSTIKDIERQIQEAARRKKEEEAKKQILEKTDSIAEAMEHHIKLEEEITRKRFDYAKFFSILFSIAFILVLWFLIYLTIKSTYFKKEDPWKRITLEKNILESAPGFIEKEIFKNRSWRTNLIRHFSTKSPRNWLINSEKALDGKDFKNFKTVTTISQDSLHIGDRAECFVEYISNTGESLIFRLEYSNGEFKFLNVKHRSAVEEKKK